MAIIFYNRRSGRRPGCTNRKRKIGRYLVLLSVWRDKPVCPCKLTTTGKKGGVLSHSSLIILFENHPRFYLYPLVYFFSALNISSTSCFVSSMVQTALVSGSSRIDWKILVLSFS